MAPRRSREGMDPADDPRATGSLALRRRPGNAEGSASGPYDEDDLDPESSDDLDRVDFGALLVPVPANGTVAVEPRGKGRLQAVHVSLPEGRLSVSALAAPTTSRLWPELATEINASLRDGGARVRSFQGRWGRELHARTGGATSVFVGIDGPRWMLYGVATGPERDAVALDAELRRMLGDTVVVRGVSPYPVRTVLPLELPEYLAPATDEADAAAGPKIAAESDVPAAPAPVAARNGRPRLGSTDDGPPTEVLPPLRPAVARGSHPLDPDPQPTMPIALRAVSDWRPTPEPEPATELLPVVRPVPTASTSAPRRSRRARHAPEKSSAAAPRGHDPALTFLLADPMALFTAAPAGRHRRR